MPLFDYAPAPESRAIANLKPAYRPFINGEFRDGAAADAPTVNPGNEVVLAQVSEPGTSRRK